MSNINFTREELQAILHCVLFSTCPDAVWDDADDDKTIKLHKQIMKKFADEGWTTEPDIYIFGHSHYEDKSLVDFVTNKTSLTTVKNVIIDREETNE
jgi:hypothetical protein